MTLAVLSGKGGTGKTLLAVNLAAVMDRPLYLDCDVEAPNGRLFFNPQVNKEYCQKKSTKILTTIKYNISIGKFGSEGRIAAREDVGEIPYDQAVIRLLNEGKSIVDEPCLAGSYVEGIYKATLQQLNP